MTLYVKLLNSAGVVIGDGPLVNIISASFTESIDQAGEWSVTIPANDTRSVSYAMIADGIELYAPDGYIRRGLIRNRTTSVGDQPLLTLSGPDLVGELTNYTCGWIADYNTDIGGGEYGDDINTDVIPDIADGTGWTINDDASLGVFCGTLNGLTRLGALQAVREVTGSHFRHSATNRTLDFGALGDSSGLRIVNVAHVLKAQDSNTTIALVSNLEVLDDIWDVCNLIIPFGAGDDGDYLTTSSNNYGKVRLVDILGTGIAAYTTTDIQVRGGLRGGGVETVTTAGSVGTTVTVASTTGMVAGRRVFIGDKTNAEDHDIAWTGKIASITDATHFELSFAATVGNGRDVIVDPQFYLYDSTAYAANPRESCIVFPDVDIPYRQPVGINIAQFPAASLMLYNKAKAYLNTHATARTVYGVTPIRLPSSLLPGQTVALEYHGRVTRGGVSTDWLDVDATLSVISVSRSYGGDGSRSYGIEVSSVMAQRVNDAVAIKDVAGDVRSIKRRA